MMRTDAYREFKKHLFTGGLKPGQFVSQRELTALIGVPLNPIREAIRQLESEKLIRVYPQRGIQIVEGDPRTVNEGYDYRLLLEKAAVQDFAATAPLEYIEKIKQDNEGAAAALEQNPGNRSAMRTATETAWNFHEAIIDFQGNRIISHHYRLNSARIRLFRADLDQFQKCLAPALREHVGILDACIVRDTEEAVRLITDHIEVSRGMALGLKAA